MQSDKKLAEAAVLSLKSQTEACNSELREVEDQLSRRRAELRQLELTLAEMPVPAVTLSSEVLLWMLLVQLSVLLFFTPQSCVTDGKVVQNSFNSSSSGQSVVMLW